MTKKLINQKGKLDEVLINTIEPNFIFADKPINRFNIINNNEDAHPGNKADLLKDLQSKINSIEDCSLKDDSKSLKIDVFWMTLATVLVFIFGFYYNGINLPYKPAHPLYNDYSGMSPSCIYYYK